MGLKCGSKCGYLIVGINLIISILIFILSAVGIYITYSHRDIDGFAIAIFSLISCLFLISFASLMIIGIAKKRHTLMKPWLIFFIMVIIYEVLYVLSYFDGFYLLETAIVVLIVIGLNLLWHFPIYILYKDIRDGNIENLQNDLANQHKGEKNFPYQTEKEMV